MDGNTGTRWSSQFSDPQWLQVDLGSVQTLCQVVLTWETAAGKAYQIQTSNDGSSWTTVYSTTTGAGGTETLSVSGSGRYVRMYGTARTTGYGYSLWEFAVYGAGSGTPPPPTGGSLGSNVYVFDPSMSQASIQSTLNSIANQQGGNEFGTQRYALLFKPGTYGSAASPLNFSVGFYESVAGLGKNPGDVVINGSVDVYNQCNGGDQSQCYATTNFWRSLSNLTINVAGKSGCYSGDDFWAVSQAAPLRRVHINGNLTLMDYCTGSPTGPAAASSPTPSSPAAPSPTARSSSSSPATARWTAGATRSGTRSSAARRARPRRPSPPTPVSPAVLPPTRRSPPARSPVRRRTCTWTPPGTTRSSSPTPSPTPAAPPGRPAPPRAPRSR
ncbi:discoidin domain-containing protein [Streptacidiphilus monticola]